MVGICRRLLPLRLVLVLVLVMHRPWTVHDLTLVLEMKLVMLVLVLEVIEVRGVGVVEMVRVF